VGRKIKLIRKPSDEIGNRNLDLSDCKAVCRQTASPLTATTDNLSHHHNNTVYPRTYILTYLLLQKTDFSKLFWALCEGPRGSTPAFSDSSPRAKYRGIFSRLSTPKLTNDFTQALQPPTSPLRLHHIRIPLLASRMLRSFLASLPPS